MKYFAICRFITFTAQALSRAEVTKLSAEHRKALQDISRFQEIRLISNLPPKIVALCADHKGRMADPGKKWQVSDVVIDDSLSFKRLIWAATDNDYYVVHYEHGGIARGCHLLIARLKQRDATPIFVWHGVGKPLKDFGAAVAAIVNNELDDRLDYTH